MLQQRVLGLVYDDYRAGNTFTVPMVFGSLIFSSHNNILHLTVLLHHYISTQSPHHHHKIYYIVEPDFLFAIDISPRPLLSAILSKLFPPHVVFKFMTAKSFPSALQTYDNQSMKKSSEIITIVAGSFLLESQDSQTYIL